MGLDTFLLRPLAGTLIGSVCADLDATVHTLLGLSALADEMNRLGVSRDQLFHRTGVDSGALEDAKARISYRQKIAIFRNCMRLTPDPTVGLRVGQRQRLSDFGIVGYGAASSATRGEAIAFGIKHVGMSGALLEWSFRVEGDTAIVGGRDFIGLGDLLRLATEFGFSSMRALANHIVDGTSASRRLLLPYPAPGHASVYESVFGCPVEFDSGTTEWHFSAGRLAAPCPNANPITASLCASVCERALEKIEDVEPTIVRSIKMASLNSNGAFPTAEILAARLNMSPRTFHRRLAEIGTSYRQILDEVRHSLAIEYLESSSLPIDEVAARTGFSDVSNFRKAFKKWTGRLPSYYRRG